MAEPCEYKEIILKMVDVQGEFRGIVSGMASDIGEIKARVNNGLTAEIKDISKDLAKSISDAKEAAIIIKADAKMAATEVKTDVKLAAEKVRGENFLGRIFQGSAKKLLGMGVTFLILNAIVTSGAVQLVKEKWAKELPGQQQQIMQKAVDIQTILITPHIHILSDGSVLSHTGDANVPAWRLNPRSNIWEKAPTMRTEGNIR